jgi:hypothetical protein
MRTRREKNPEQLEVRFGEIDFLGVATKKVNHLKRLNLAHFDLLFDPPPCLHGWWAM